MSLIVQKIEFLLYQFVSNKAQEQINSVQEEL